MTCQMDAIFFPMEIWSYKKTSTMCALMMVTWMNTAHLLEDKLLLLSSIEVFNPEHR